jgi:hypothetical protein
MKPGSDDHQPKQQPKLLDRVRAALRTKRYSPNSEKAYVHWIKRFIFFHNKRHPSEMGEPEINRFLTHLAVKEKVAASTQNQALSAILFFVSGSSPAANWRARYGNLGKEAKKAAGGVHPR